MEKTKCFIFKTCKHKCFFLPFVVLSLPPVVVGLDSVLCDDSNVLWTVVWVLSYVLSVSVVVVISYVSNTQLLFEMSFLRLLFVNIYVKHHLMSCQKIASSQNESPIFFTLNVHIN